MGLATAMSSWEYLLLRVQQEDEGNSTAPLIPRILNEVTSLMAKVSAVASQYLQPLHNDPNAEAFQLKNQRTARLIDLQCGTYFISKDDRKILEDHSLLDETLTADADATVNSDTIHTSCVDDQKLKEEESTTTTDLWDASKRQRLIYLQQVLTNRSSPEVPIPK